MSIKQYKHAGQIISLCIYIAFVIASHLIGHRYSCTWVKDVYFWCSLILLAGLFSVPFIFAPKLHGALRALLAFLNAAAGIAIWIWSFDAAHMALLCSIPM